MMKLHQLKARLASVYRTLWIELAVALHHDVSHGSYYHSKTEPKELSPSKVNWLNTAENIAGENAQQEPQTALKAGPSPAGMGLFRRGKIIFLSMKFADEYEAMRYYDMWSKDHIYIELHGKKILNETEELSQ